jgi:CRISPR-associated protein Csb1
MFEALKGKPRLLIEVDLEPVQGDRFQPTGFPDLGAAVYEAPGGVRKLLIESAQSIANRLESTILDGTGPRICEELEGLPYVLVKLTGGSETYTSSLTEAHRVNSPFIISDEGFQKLFKDKSGYKKGAPLDWQKIGATFLAIDPNSILHGVFMANLEDGRIKMPRVVSGFIEAEGVRECASGGVKNNPIDPTGKLRANNYDKDVYSNVPYHRVEYTADRITGYFNIDLALIDGYGFPAEANELLVALVLLKISRFINTGLRLRTACDLSLKGVPRVTEPVGFELPSEEELLETVQKGIKDCTAKGLFESKPVTDITTATSWKTPKK